MINTTSVNGIAETTEQLIW